MATNAPISRSRTCSSRISNTSDDVPGSRFPVGSSANAGAWLVTLARRKVARILRDQIGVAARDPRRERSIPTDVPLADRRSGPVTVADRKDRLALLEAALDRLSPDHREVIVLTRIEKLGAREVADRMGRSENAVHLLLGRALKRLAVELEL